MDYKQMSVEKDPMSNIYVASSHLLDLHDEGDTKERALSNLIEMIELFFASIYEMGTFDQVFEEIYKKHNLKKKEGEKE